MACVFHPWCKKERFLVNQGVISIDLGSREERVVFEHGSEQGKREDVARLMEIGL